MSEHPHIPTKILFYIGIAVGLIICILMVLATTFDIHTTWPAYLTLPIFFLAGNDTKQLPHLFIGACSGLIFTALFFIAYAALVPVLGAHLAPLLLVFVILVLIIGLGNVVPMVFNNYNLVYFTVAIAFYTVMFAINPAYPLIPETLKMIGITLVGGGAFVGGTLLFIGKILPKILAPKA
ncbi:MAG TPA: hypothetical protein P5549_10040 [Syntrophomonas sp.]|nr:hypothetical protein [Syntrophomonas sp.]